MAWAAALLFFFSLAVVSASHYRYATLRWAVTTGNTVNFTMESAWRRSYYNPRPNVGNVLTLDGYVYFGDGAQFQVRALITAVSFYEDWFISTAYFLHTYPTANDTKNGEIPWKAVYSGGQRISTLNNNANANWNLMTTVDCNEGSSPISKMLPVANVLVVQNPVASFAVPAVVNTNDQLHYALATSYQICGFNTGCTQPPGLVVDPASGVVTWNTTNQKQGLWTAVIIISTPTVYITADFIINVTQVAGTCAQGCTNPGKSCYIPSTCGTCSSVSCVKPLPPYFVAPTPASNLTIAVALGSAVNFVVAAKSPQNSSVFIQQSSFPDGATLTSNSGSNPATGVFSWTPASYQVGSTIVCFSATDVTGLASLQYCLLIEVSVGCNPACGKNSYCNAGTCNCLEGYTGPNCATYGGLLPDATTIYGSVASHAYNYYYLDLVDNAQSIKLIVENYDPSQSTAVFISTKGNPIITNNTWNSVDNNPNAITIYPNDPNYIVGRYYIGVEGWYGALRTIDYNITVFVN